MRGLPLSGTFPVSARIERKNSMSAFPIFSAIPCLSYWVCIDFLYGKWGGRFFCFQVSHLFTAISFKRNGKKEICSSKLIISSKAIFQAFVLSMQKIEIVSQVWPGFVFVASWPARRHDYMTSQFRSTAASRRRFSGSLSGTNSSNAQRSASFSASRYRRHTAAPSSSGFLTIFPSRTSH